MEYVVNPAFSPALSMGRPSHTIASRPTLSLRLICFRAAPARARAVLGGPKVSAGRAGAGDARRSDAMPQGGAAGGPVATH